MGGVYGIDQLSKILVLLAELGNVLEQVIVHKKALAFFSLSDELFGLASLDVALFKKQLAELDEADRALLLGKLKEKLQLENQKLEALIVDGAELAELLVVDIAKVLAFSAKLKG